MKITRKQDLRSYKNQINATNVNISKTHNQGKYLYSFTDRVTLKLHLDKMPTIKKRQFCHIKLPSCYR